MKPAQTLAALAIAGTTLAVATPVFGQSAPPPAPQQWTFRHTPAAVISDLGLYLYPKNNQTPDQQAKDTTECLLFANSQTGIELDTFTKTGQSAEEKQAAAKPQGGAAKGAAKGAAAGAAVGAIAGDAGTGAGVGAAAGAMAGRRAKKQGEKEAAEQQKAAAAKALQDARDTVKKPLSACLDAKGYSAK